jgi:uncharacterized protein (TIGR00369 family)
MNTSDLREVMPRIVPYWQTLGLELKEVEAGRAVFEGVARPELMQNGTLHGGVLCPKPRKSGAPWGPRLASIADSACAVAAISRIFPENYATTINLQVAYLKPVSAGRFRAVGRCVRAGRQVLFSQAEVFDEGGALVCSAQSQLMAVPWQGKKP